MYGIEEHEKIIVEVRKHWFVIFRAVLPYVIGLFLPFIAFSYLTSGSEIQIGPSTTLSFDTNTALIVFWGGLWVLLMWTKIFHIWTDYYLDKMIITDEKVIDIDQQNLFKRHVSVFRMDKIQDVTLVTAGFFGTTLNYGCIYIQTAGTSEKFAMKAVPHPGRVRDIILAYQDTALQASKSSSL